MDLFKDKKREGFDELTQLIEPFIYQYNNVVSKLPEEFEITFDDIMNLTGGSINSYVSRSKILTLAFQKAEINEADISYATRQELRNNAYKFEITGNVEFDMSVPAMKGGTIKAVKEAKVMNDEQIMEKMIRGISENMLSYGMKASDCKASRFHELAESFGFYEEMKKQSSFNGRKKLLKEKVLEQVQDNTIRIRDFELGLRFGSWIKAFLIDGNLAALKNIATLKIMSHNDEAIYSINEEKI